MSLKFLIFLPVITGIVGGFIGGRLYKDYQRKHPGKS